MLPMSHHRGLHSKPPNKMRREHKFRIKEVVKSNSKLVNKLRVRLKK